MTDQTAYLNLGEVVRYYLDIQAENGNRYARGEGYSVPNLATAEHGDGRTLRITGDLDDRYAMTIHPDDVREYVKRVADYRLRTGAIDQREHAHLIAGLDRPLRDA